MHTCAPQMFTEHRSCVRAVLSGGVRMIAGQQPRPSFLNPQLQCPQPVGSKWGGVEARKSNPPPWMVGGKEDSTEWRTNALGFEVCAVLGPDKRRERHLWRPEQHERRRGVPSEPRADSVQRNQWSSRGASFLSPGHTWRALGAFCLWCRPCPCRRGARSATEADRCQQRMDGREMSMLKVG